MEPYYTDDTCKIYHGDVRDCLRALPDGSVQCCVTSPPYWALRDYGVEGQLGLEPTPEEYVANMVEVFREVRRVLRSDGVLWLNIGDSYNAYNGGAGPGSKLSKTQNDQRPKLKSGFGLQCKSLKPKDLIGIPWMLAFALRADGWYLRSEVIWAKRSPMPESVRDRPSKAHEQIFLLSPNRRYYWDSVGSKEEAVGGQPGNKTHKAKTAYEAGDLKHRTKAGLCEVEAVDRRNMRSVWSLSSYSLKAAHFAAFPPELVRRCLTAGVSVHGSCKTCGMPWDRIAERKRVPTRSGIDSKVNRASQHEASPYETHGGTVVGNRDPQRHVTQVVTVGWKQGCDCTAGEPVPCTVLDPFHGAGTTWKVCQRLGLNYIGTELNSEYIDLSVARSAVHFPHERNKSKRLKKVKPDGQRELFA